MSSLATPTLAQMSVGDLLSNYNALAPALGREVIKRWTGSHCELATRFAILRTYKPKGQPVKVTRAKRKRGVFDAVVDALEFVSHYEDRGTGKRVAKQDARNADYPVVAVGLSYPKVRERVLKTFPEANPTPQYLRWVLCQLREDKERAALLPEKRPRSNWTKETRQCKAKPRKSR